jgi:hypothetical protein
MNRFSKYGIAFFAVTVLFAILHTRDSLRPVTCWDCFFPYGVPFTFYQEGGYAGGAGVVWKGLVADAALVIVVSALVGHIWQTLNQTKPR